MRLAPKLGISSEELNKTFAKYGPNDALATSSSQDELWTQKANHAILTNWINNQDNREDAFVFMRDALIQAGLKLFAKEILDYDRPSTSLRRVLTDDLMPQLSAMLTEEDLKHLVSEMGIPLQDDEETFQESCSDETPSRIGILQILSTWLMVQKSPEEAHVALTTALKRLGINIAAELMHSLAILLKNLVLTTDRISTEPHSIVRTKSESTESTLVEPNPFSISVLPATEPMPTSVSTADPKYYIPPDSELLSTQEILEIESDSSSERESTVPPRQKVDAKFSFLLDKSFSGIKLRPISDLSSGDHCPICGNPFSDHIYLKK